MNEISKHVFCITTHLIPSPMISSVTRFHDLKMETAKALPSEIEESVMKQSTETVNMKVRGKQMLGDGRLSILFANESVNFGKVLEFGEKNGNGTFEARGLLRKRWVDMREVDERAERTLNLSSRSRFVYVKGVASTHSLHFVKPEVIASRGKVGARWCRKWD